MAIDKLKYLVTADTTGFSGPIKAIGALVVTAFVAAIKITADFEKELSKLRAISGATATEMVVLEKQARNLGKSTAFTAREVAGLQTELAKLGFTTNDILNSSGGVLDLAAGLGVTLADAAALTGTTLRAFGLTTEETGRVVDVLAKASASSALDFEKLKESLKTAAPIARATGVTLERTTAILSVMANAGISGSRAGTAFRKTMIELNKAGLSLNDAYKLVNGSTDKLGTAQKLVGTIAASGFLVMAEGAVTIDDLTEAYNKALGSAEKQRDIMEDNLIGDFDKLKSAVSEMGIKMGQTTDGPMRDMVQALTDLLNGSEDVVPILDQIDFAFNQIALYAYSAALGVYEFIKSFKDLVKLDSSGLDDTIRVLKQSITLVEGLQAKIDKARLDRKDPKKKVKKPGTVPTGGGGGDGDPVANAVSGLSGGFGGEFDTNGLTGVSKGFDLITGSITDASAAMFGFNKAFAASSNDNKIADTEAAVEKYQGYLDEVSAKNKLIEESFASLGNNIAQSLGATEGIFGAFVGTLIQGLLQLVATQITSAATTAATSATKVAAHSTVATAAAVAGAAESAAATGPGAIVTLPIFIGAALAAVAAAFSGIGGSKGGSGGGSGSSRSAVKASPLVAASSVQGSNQELKVVGEIDGQVIRLVMQRAEDSYAGIS